MQKLEVIGNLGADAELKNYNGSEFISFRVADTQKVNGNDVTTWIDCTMNGNGGKLMQFLKAGTKVFVSGRPAYRIFDSAKYHCKMVGVQLFVNQCELCGGSNDAVPRELITADGQIVTVAKYYNILDENIRNCTLTDKNLQQYDVNEHGWVAPHSENKSGNQES